MRVPLRLALLPMLALATRASAQEEPTVPPCDGHAPDAAPCRARYDTAPVLEPGSEPPLPAGEARTPLVWIYVDETGAVRRAQVHQPAGGVDWDVAARDRARQFRFRPAVLEGRAVGAWVLMPVRAVPPPASCAGAGPLPLSAGAVLVDSMVSGRPEVGTGYRYAARGFPMDVFVYPHTGDETPRSEVEKTLGALQQGVRGGPDSIAVVRAGEERLRPGGRFRRVEFAGYSAVFRARFAEGWMESYAAVFRAGDQDLKIRATYPEDGGARRQVAEFVEQILSYRAYLMSGCPR